MDKFRKEVAKMGTNTNLAARLMAAILLTAALPGCTQEDEDVAPALGQADTCDECGPLTVQDEPFIPCAVDGGCPQGQVCLLSQDKLTGTCGVAGPETCADGVDNDQDEQADCADLDCAGQGQCPPAPDGGDADAGSPDAGGCVPTCPAGRECGGDGCGGECGGGCAAGEQCNEQFQCRPLGCGNGACGANENCETCPEDCGPCECQVAGDCADDENPCTTATCVAGQCVNTNNNNPCSDGNACTTNDACSGGMCMGGPALVCNDGSGCTNDVCNPASGCTYPNNNAACNDNDPCTGNDACNGGVCGGAPIPNCPAECQVAGDCADDGNPCTTATCVAGQCVNNNNNNPCSDENACTTSDACSGGMCMGGPALVCNDGSGCTNDVCNPASGCTYPNNNAACNDNNPCTGNDACNGGVCGGTPILDCPGQCGNGQCNLGESCNSCPQDCGQCIPNEVCGNFLDDDGDGATDCFDQECGPNADGYVFRVFGTVDPASPGWVELIYDAIPSSITLEVPGPDANGDPQQLRVALSCAEINSGDGGFAAVIQGGAGTPQTSAWVGGNTPEFVPYIPWPAGMGPMMEPGPPHVPEPTTQSVTIQGQARYLIVYRP